MLSLIGTLIVVVIVSVFAGFNLNNTCNINFIYKTIENVPVFMALIIAFVAGVVVTLPYVFVKRAQRKSKEAKTEKSQKIVKEFKWKHEKDSTGAGEAAASGAVGGAVSPEAAAKLAENDDNSPRMQ